MPLRFFQDFALPTIMRNGDHRNVEPFLIRVLRCKKSLRLERERRSITIHWGGKDAFGLARSQPPLDDPAHLDILQPMLALPNSLSFPPFVHEPLLI